MAGAVQRVFAVLEYLLDHPEGAMMSHVAEALSLPVSATHRALGELIAAGFVHQRIAQGPYFVTMKLTSMGLGYLSRAGIADVAQPALDGLALRSGELVRLAVADADSLVFVARAQGSRTNLRYDPDMGLNVQLSCSAAGHAFLAAMADQPALELVFQQGFGRPEDFGPLAPTSALELLTCLARVREQGFSTIRDQFAPNMSSMGAAVHRPSDGAVIGVVTIAGPSFRLTEQKMEELGPDLLAAAREIGGLSIGSGYFGR